MESKKYLFSFLFGVGLVACCLVFFLVGKWTGYQRGYDAAMSEPHKADTVFKVDTHFVDRPVEKWKTKEKVVFVPVHDSTLVTIHDTTYIALNRERKGYSGDDYELEITGIEPNLEWIKTYQKTQYITNTIVEKKRWSFGVTAGPGVMWDGKEIKPGLGIVAGFGYNF